MESVQHLYDKLINIYPEDAETNDDKDKEKDGESENEKEDEIEELIPCKNARALEGSYTDGHGPEKVEFLH